MQTSEGGDSKLGSEAQHPAPIHPPSHPSPEPTLRIRPCRRVEARTPVLERRFCCLVQCPWRSPSFSGETFGCQGVETKINSPADFRVSSTCFWAGPGSV